MQLSDDTAYWLWWLESGDEIRYLTGNGEVKSVSLTFAGNAVQFSAPHSPIRINVNTNRRGLSTSGNGVRVIAATVTVEDPGPAVLLTHFDAGLP